MVYLGRAPGVLRTADGGAGEGSSSLRELQVGNRRQNNVGYISFPAMLIPVFSATLLAQTSRDIDAHQFSTSNLPFSSDYQPSDENVFQPHLLRALAVLSGCLCELPGTPYVACRETRNMKS